MTLTEVEEVPFQLLHGKIYSKSLILQHFCLQNRPSFGKTQLLTAPFLANQNKNKRRENLNLIIFYF